MGHIQDRGRDSSRKRWRARVRRPGGGEVSKSFGRKVDARRWLTEQEHAKATGEWVDPAAGRRPFGEWLDQWLASRARQVRRSTFARDESYCRNHLRPAFGTAPLAAITQPDVVAWVGELHEDKGLAAATVRKAYTLLGQVLQAAVDAQLLARTPCSNVPLPKAERPDMRFLTAAEVARLTEAVDGRYRAAVLVLAYGGLRISELAGLKRSRWDQVNRQLQVAEQVVWVKGHATWGAPKTAAGRRKVALPGMVAEGLGRHLEMHAGEELVFPAPEKGGPLRVSTWRRRYFNPAVQQAGLGHVRIHDLRHTAVSLWIAQGADVKAVAARAGHSSVSFTLDRYGHLYPDRDAALADRLDELARGAQKAAGDVVDLDDRRAERA